MRLNTVMLTATAPASFATSPRFDASPTCHIERHRGAPGGASGGLKQFRPSGAALYARPSGVSAGVSLHRHGTSGAVSRSIQITRRSPRAGNISPVRAGTPPPVVSLPAAVQNMEV
jgi:hypothetical protein